MSSVPLRVAFFGLPVGALALHRVGVTPCVIALGHPDAPGARRVRRHLSSRALVLARPDLADEELHRAIASAKPDVLLSWFWPRLIPEAVLRLAPRGAFGVHPSLLPRWRGPDPYFWALFRGDSHTGVSLHRLSSDYDTGELIAQWRVPIARNHNAWTLAKRLDAPSLSLFVEAARQLAAGEELYGTAQAEEHSTQAPQPGEDLTTLHWQDSALELVNQIRALAPHPGAATTLGDEEVEVLTASVYEGKLPRALQAGDAVSCNDLVVICAGQGGVVLERVRTTDGTLLFGAQVAELFPTGLFRLS